MRKSLAVSVLLLLSGCGNYHSVRIPYVLPGSGDIIETRRALSSLYISVKYPPLPEEGPLGSVLGSLLNGPAVEFNNYALARKTAAAFSRPGARVSAYRVSRSTGEGDAYARYFNPSGVLELKMSDLRFSAKKEDRSSVYYDKKKNRQTVKNTVWVYQASVRAEITLYSGTYLKALDTAYETFSLTEDLPDNKKDPADWYAENENKILNDAAARLSARYIGKEVLRSRPLFRKKDDKEAAKAADLAMRDKWEEAVDIWGRRQAANNDWRDTLGLAVAAEVRKDYPAAKEHYLRAREASSGDKDAASVRWSEILGDLDVMLDSGTVRAPAEEDWFAASVAVLPFTDETTSVDGPPMLRAIIRDALKTAGYRVQALEDTDKILMEHGFTQGGQLGAAGRAELCKWLGVKRLVYGDIKEFGEIMAGVYNRRMIKGSVTLWDLKTGDFIWDVSPSVVRVRTSKNFMAGMFSQLAKGLAERMKNKPLAYEAAVFSGLTVEALPNKAR